jgi:hypothetical protein
MHSLYGSCGLLPLEVSLYPSYCTSCPNLIAFVESAAESLEQREQILDMVPIYVVLQFYVRIIDLSQSAISE